MPCRYVDDTNGPVWNGSSCTACPEEKPNWSVMLYRCEPPCLPSQSWNIWECSSTASICNKRGKFVLNGECVDACPETWDKSNVCVSCKELDESLPFWDYKTKRCVATCPDGKQPTDDTTRCPSCQKG